MNRFGLGLAMWLVVLTALLTGCAPRSGAGALTPAPAEGALAVDLPALVIDYDREGVPSIAGQPLAALGSTLPASLQAQLKLPASAIETLIAANIQHFQLSNTPTGLQILVNGQPVTSLVWDDLTLRNLLNLLRPMAPTVAAQVEQFLPTVTRLGTGVTLRFPLQQGANPLPLAATGEASNALRQQETQQAFLTAAGAAPTLQIPVYYDPEGRWTVAGLTDSEWQALTGLPFGGLRLSPQLMADLNAAGIRQATVRADAAGLHLFLNGKALPYVSWEEGELLTLLALAQQAGFRRQRQRRSARC